MSWLAALWAAPTAAGFAVAFGVPWRWLAVVALLGAAGRLLRHLGEQAGHSPALATLAGSALIACGAILATRRGRRDTAMIAVPAVIPLLPGTLLYRSVLAFAQADRGPGHITDALVLGVQAAGIMLALVVGLALPQLLAGAPAQRRG